MMRHLRELGSVYVVDYLSDVNYSDGFFFLRIITARVALDIGSRLPTNPHKSTNSVKESETLATRNAIDRRLTKSIA